MTEWTVTSDMYGIVPPPPLSLSTIEVSFWGILGHLTVQLQNEVKRDLSW